MRRKGSNLLVMHPVVRAVGKMLRLVGISSPEDSAPKQKTAADPPSWKTTPKKPRKDIGIDRS